MDGRNSEASFKKGHDKWPVVLGIDRHQIHVCAISQALLRTAFKKAI